MLSFACLRPVLASFHSCRNCELPCIRFFLIIALANLLLRPLLAEMKHQPGSSFSVSEETPFVKSRSKPTRLRQMSVTQRFISGVRKAVSAFEYEMSALDDETEQTSQTREEAKPPDARRKCKSLMLLIAGCLFGAFLIHHLSSRKRYGRSCSNDPIEALQTSSSLEGLQHAAVASDHEICSEVGTSILRSGGNAVDAAVATMLCLGVANPASSGLGGGAFILIHSDKVNFQNRVEQERVPPFRDSTNGALIDSNGKITEVIDCRETAPAAASFDMFATKPDSASSFGGLAVAVPGELRGLELAHARHVSPSFVFRVAQSVVLIYICL